MVKRIAYAEKPLQKEKVEEIVQRVANMERLKDVRTLIPLLVLQQATINPEDL